MAYDEDKLDAEGSMHDNLRGAERRARADAERAYREQLGEVGAELVRLRRRAERAERERDEFAAEVERLKMQGALDPDPLRDATGFDDSGFYMSDLPPLPAAYPDPPNVSPEARALAEKIVAHPEQELDGTGIREWADRLAAEAVGMDVVAPAPPIPAPAPCNARRSSYMGGGCTRPLGHDGPHVCATGDAWL